MIFYKTTPYIISFMVITQILTTVYGNQCISSDGNLYSVYASYYNGNYKYTEFWLYQNKHMCQLSVNQTEISIDDSGDIYWIQLNDIYRHWFEFKSKDSIYECRRVQARDSCYANLFCGKDDYPFRLMNVSPFSLYFNTTFVYVEGNNGQIGERLDIAYVEQNELWGKWKRDIHYSSFQITRLLTDWYLKKIEPKSKASQTLKDLISDIDNSLYINAVVNAYDGMSGTTGFYIFVTYEGIPMYCYKSNSKDQTESCQIENLKVLENKRLSASEQQPSGLKFTFTIMIAILILIAITVSLILYVLFKPKNKKFQAIENEPIIHPKDINGEQVSNISQNVENKETKTELKTLPLDVNSKPNVENESQVSESHSEISAKDKNI